MTEAEFRQQVECFWSWVSKTERPASSWFDSLGEWAADNYNTYYRKERLTTETYDKELEYLRSQVRPEPILPSQRKSMYEDGP